MTGPPSGVGGGPAQLGDGRAALWLQANRIRMTDPATMKPVSFEWLAGRLQPPLAAAPPVRGRERSSLRHFEPFCSHQASQAFEVVPGASPVNRERAVRTDASSV